MIATQILTDLGFKEIIDVFKMLNIEKNITVIVVTHDPDIAAIARKIVHLRDGLIVNGKTE